MVAFGTTPTIGELPSTECYIAPSAPGHVVQIYTVRCSEIKAVSCAAYQ